MAKIASGVLVAVLLVATIAAFAITEKLKLTPSPITGPQVDRVFSPVCECASPTARISFRVRKPDRVTVEVVDGDGSAVRQLMLNRSLPAGRVSLQWDGRDDAGAVVPEGEYRPRVHLARQRRTITMPSEIRVDVTPPQVVAFAVRPLVFSPDGDGVRDAVIARYRVSERATVALLANGRRVVLKRGTRLRGELRWTGEIAGQTVDAGDVALSLRVTDLAGNRAHPPDARVRVRFISLGRRTVEVAPGARFAVLVVTDARSFRWRLGTARGSGSPGSLRLTAPLVPGRYTLVVEANGHAARAAVLVAEPTP